MNQSKVLLIAMPWHRWEAPAIQLGTLQAYLKQNDIASDCKYYYLRLADKLGLPLYKKLATEEYLPSVIYSELLWSEQEKVFETFVQKKYKDKNSKKVVDIDFRYLVHILKEFHQEIIAELDLKQYDVIGFTIGYQQKLPSLVLAREIKKRAPEKIIVFGGSSCFDELGKSLISAFPDCIDIVVSGEGEETLVEIVEAIRSGYSYTSMKGTYVSDQAEIILNEPRPLIKTLNSLPIPEYDDFFTEYEKCQHINYSPLNIVQIPIEGSRGCWWNKCAFCGLNRQFIDGDGHTFFRAKNVPRIMEELAYQKNKYKVLHFNFLDNVQFRINELTAEILNQSVDYTLGQECRANLTAQDCYHMAEAGMTNIQIGIESFSKSILQKMQKGIRAIENVNALKWCQVFNIQVGYNVIKTFPTETREDVLEGIRLVKKISHLPPPYAIIPYVLVYDSPVYQQPEKFNISRYYPSPYYKYIYDPEILDKMIVANYDFDLIEPLDTEDLWEEFMQIWKSWKEKYQDISLIYLDGGEFLKIIDTRSEEKLTIMLDKRQREVYLYCDFIRSKEEIYAHFWDWNRDELGELLADFIKLDLFMEEEQMYLSLALPVSGLAKRRIVKGYFEK